MPSRGIGPKPKISAGEAGIITIAPASVIRAGTFTLPEPRRAAASRFTIQTAIEPANRMLEYCSAASSEPSRPPSAPYSAGPPQSMPPVNSAPETMASTTEWNTSESASFWRPAPIARAIEEATPLPSPPFDMVVISMKIGNTSATPASASVPRKLT